MAYPGATGRKAKTALEGSKKVPGKESPTALSRAEKQDPEPAANASKDSPNPEDTTPEQEAKRESEERVKGLLEAYQETLDAVEELPAVV